MYIVFATSWRKQGTLKEVLQWAVPRLWCHTDVCYLWQMWSTEVINSLVCHTTVWDLRREAACTIPFQEARQTQHGGRDRCQHTEDSWFDSTHQRHGRVQRIKRAHGHRWSGVHSRSARTLHTEYYSLFGASQPRKTSLDRATICNFPTTILSLYVLHSIWWVRSSSCKIYCDSSVVVRINTMSTCN